MPEKPPDIEKRMFVVGSGRCGSTLLQVLLGSHPNILAFPETFFFDRLAGGVLGSLLRAGVPMAPTRVALARVREEIGDCASGPLEPGRFMGPSAAIDCFREMLDRHTLEAGKGIWVEKTPSHLDYIELIQRHLPDAHFVHVLRDGLEVVASIRRRARNYPTIFRNQESYRHSTRRWNRAIRTSARYADQANHTIISYEQLVADTEGELRRICGEAQFDFDSRMLSPRADVAEYVAPEERPWLKGAHGPVVAAKLRFGELFKPDEQARICKRLELDLYEKLLAESYA